MTKPTPSHLLLSMSSSRSLVSLSLFVAYVLHDVQLYGVQSFTLPTPLIHNPSAFLTTTQRITTTTTLYMAKKQSKNSKGFGKQTQSTSSSSTPNSTTTNEITSTTPSSPDTTKLNNNNNNNNNNEPLQGGKEALSRLRQAESKRKEDELRAIKQMRSVDNYVKENSSAAVIPEKVAMRMGKRMLPFVGIPLFGVMGAFVLFWYLATYKNMEFQPGLVAFSTVGILGVGLIGITYSVMSASWDPDVEGTTLGVDEFKTNFSNIKEGLGRSRENAILREKMQGLSEEEITAAIRDLDKRDERLMKERASLKDKLEKELK